MTATATRARRAAPAADRTEVRVRGSRERRTPWVALGALLVLVGGLVFGLVVQSAGNRASVVVAARDISPGQVVEAADLRLVEVAIDGEAEVVAGSRRDELVGQVATGPIAAGSLVSEAQFATGSGLASGQVVVGALLGPGPLPVPNLRVGDTVGVLDGGSGAGGERSESASVGTATVFLVTPGQQPGTQFLSLLVEEELAPLVAELTAGQRLRLVLLPPEATG